ncbi:VOC family protein [Bacillus thermotolerans]|uniref:VOC family protein n=1 Tax=Bacillus thermotolerans TaxID=1221996 RepID=UPI000591CB5D|nr:VOC family protein [Bacillus thermotolerans]KKB44853.1 Lactoylglutathione lyase [Bacillus thermotolerans]
MEPLFTEVLQVGVVVKDLDQTMKTYADKYGIGPWNVYEFNKDTVADMSIGGKRMDYAMRLALADIGGVQWELIEPLDDRSDYARFLKEHGEGIHHVALDTDSYESAVEFCEKNGISPIQYGYWGRNFRYDYRDTRGDLKCISELYGPDPGFEWPEPSAVYPEEPMERKPVFTDVLQIGVVVKNINETLKTYTDKYGIGPWNVYEFNKDTVADMSIGGKRMDYAMRLALADIGGVQWELIEPLDDRSDYARFLKEHGEGIHHVALDTDSYESAVEFCEKNGISPIQYGYWGRNFRYDYRDTQDDLKCIVELYGPDPGFEWPEPLAVYSKEKVW